MRVSGEASRSKEGKQRQDLEAQAGSDMPSPAVVPAEAELSPEIEAVDQAKQAGDGLARESSPHDEPGDAGSEGMKLEEGKNKSIRWPDEVKDGNLPRSGTPTAKRLH